MPKPSESRKKRNTLTIPDTIFSTEGTPAYDANIYINSGEVPKNKAVMMAVAALYGPMGAALRGASADEVEERIRFSDRIYAQYKESARAEANVQLPSQPEPMPEPDLGPMSGGGEFGEMFNE